MNIQRRGKWWCEISIDYCRNVYNNTTIPICSIQFIKKLPGNGYENGVKDNAMFEYSLQREDYSEAATQRCS